ncbi:MAG: class I SAM-dependent methyltransferase [Xenococcus sp. MO_188.B8]|nr:class I SAM-dependent methyltransferase [Xenococcus sp. MO_188.B8]
MNPYRNAFYPRQSEWHGNQDPRKLLSAHQIRSRYYKWYTKNWLPKDKSTPILDIGCGSGQFTYFLNKEGYKSTTGIDIDAQQIELAQSLGLNCHCAEVEEYLRDQIQSYGVISMLDILEHFTWKELYPIMELVREKLTIGGKVIVSVPNAASPLGLSTRYSDITHETSFSPASLSELFFCHGMEVRSLRDPWPAPISVRHKIFRSIAMTTRKLEGLRLRLLGLSVPQYWSPVIWAVAEKKP